MTLITTRPKICRQRSKSQRHERRKYPNKMSEIRCHTVTSNAFGTKGVAPDLEMAYSHYRLLQPTEFLITTFNTPCFNQKNPTGTKKYHQKMRTKTYYSSILWCTFLGKKKTQMVKHNNKSALKWTFCWQKWQKLTFY